MIQQGGGSLQPEPLIPGEEGDREGRRGLRTEAVPSGRREGPWTGSAEFQDEL